MNLKDYCYSTKIDSGSHKGATITYCPFNRNNPNDTWPDDLITIPMPEVVIAKIVSDLKNELIKEAADCNGFVDVETISKILNIEFKNEELEFFGKEASKNNPITTKEQLIGKRVNPKSATQMLDVFETATSLGFHNLMEEPLTREHFDQNAWIYFDAEGMFARYHVFPLEHFEEISVTDIIGEQKTQPYILGFGTETIIGIGSTKATINKVVIENSCGHKLVTIEIDDSADSLKIINHGSTQNSHRTDSETQLRWK